MELGHRAREPLHGLSVGVCHHRGARGPGDQRLPCLEGGSAVAGLRLVHKLLSTVLVGTDVVLVRCTRRRQSADHLPDGTLLLTVHRGDEAEEAYIA